MRSNSIGIGMPSEAVTGGRQYARRIRDHISQWANREAKVRRQMAARGFTEIEVRAALQVCQEKQVYWEQVLNGARRRAPGQRPLWASTPVDVAETAVTPLEGWVLLEEIFANREYQVNNVTLIIHRLYERNTVLGRIRAIHPYNATTLGLSIGDFVVYREYAGGRWSFNGVARLLTPAADILARVDDPLAGR